MTSKNGWVPAPSVKNRSTAPQNARRGKEEEKEEEGSRRKKKKSQLDQVNEDESIDRAAPTPSES